MRVLARGSARLGASPEPMSTRSPAPPTRWPRPTPFMRRRRHAAAIETHIRSREAPPGAGGGSAPGGDRERAMAHRRHRAGPFPIRSQRGSRGSPVAHPPGGVYFQGLDSRSGRGVLTVVSRACCPAWQWTHAPLADVCALCEHVFAHTCMTAIFQDMFTASADGRGPGEIGRDAGRGRADE